MPLMFFVNKINEIRDEIIERMQENKEIEMTDEDKKEFETATHCFTCGDKFKDSYKNEKEAEKYKKVRDHIVIFLQVSIEVVLIASVI